MSDKGRVVLLVDDEDPIRKALKRILKYEPYTVLDTGDPREAIEIVKKEPVHLVISDHLMPGMLGIDLLRKVRLIKEDIVRIILTGHADLEMAMQAINEGAVYRFLTKPWDNSEVLLAVRMGLRAYEIEAENRRLLKLVHKHRAVLNRLEHKQPGITGLKKDEKGLVELDQDIEEAISSLEEEFKDWMVDPNPKN